MKRKLLKQSVFVFSCLLSLSTFANNNSYVKLNHRLTPPVDAIAPSAPTGLTAGNITPTSFKLTWNASNDNVGVVSYRVYLNGVLVNNPAGPGTQLFRNITGLTPGSNNVLSVRALDAAGNVSSLSSANTNALTIVTPPNAPTGLTYSNLGTSGFLLSWNVPLGSPYIYTVYKNGVSVGNTYTPSLLVGGMNPGTSAVYTVKAFNWSPGTGASAPSSGITITTLTSLPVNYVDLLAPTTPLGGISWSGSVPQALYWSPSVDNVGVVAYKVYRNGSLVASLNSNVTSYNLSVSGTYTVYAKDAANNSSGTGYFQTVTIPDTQVPVFSAGSLSANVLSSTSVYLNCSAIATDNVNVAGYKFYKGNTLIGTTVGNVRTFTATGLTAGTTYTFSIRAYDAAGNLSIAKTATATTQSLHMMASNSNASTENLLEDLDVILSPNPVNNILTVTPKGSFDSALVGTYTIFNSSGAEVQYGSLISEIDVNDLDAGTYFIAFPELKVAAKKFVKQ